MSSFMSSSTFIPRLFLNNNKYVFINDVHHLQSHLMNILECPRDKLVYITTFITVPVKSLYTPTH